MAQTATVRWRGPKCADLIKRAQRRGVILWAEWVLEQARRIVPLDEGTLERSGQALPDSNGRSARVVFDTPYAVRQHEDLDYRHLPGRTAKYLERPLIASRRTGPKIVATQIRRAIERGGP